MGIKSHRGFKDLEKKLLSEQQELSKRIQSHLPDVFVEHEPDDEVALATYSFNRDISAAALERDRKTLAEIEASLRRIAKGEYGQCESCECAISEARLRALPWARLCIDCASAKSAPPVSDLRLRTAS